EDSQTASIQGAGEVATAIVASTITTLVVFLPIAFVRGVSGILFGDLAYVVVAALLCSLVVSLTLLPMLAARFLRQGNTAPPPWARGLYEAARSTTQRLENSYSRLLDIALNHRGRVIAFSGALLLASFALVPFIGTDFLPPSDEGQVRISGEMEVGTRLELVDQQSRVLEGIVRQTVPDAQASVASVGPGWGNAPASRGTVTLNIGPASERSKSNTEVARELRNKLAGQVPGMKVRVRAPQGQFILERLLGSEEGMTVEIRGYDLEVLEVLSKAVSAELETIDGIADIEVSRITGVPESLLTINREKISDIGLSVRDVSEALQTAVAGSQAGQYRVDGNSYRILVQLADISHVDLDQVLSMTLTTPAGGQVALRNLVTTDSGRAPLMIERKDQQRIVRIDANVAGRDLGSVASDVQERVSEIVRPVGYDIIVGGAYEEQQQASRQLSISLLLAILLVYMVLASQYESLTSPLVVMLSVPVAAVGVLVVLFLTGTTLNVQSFIGCIMLGGIVVNNAILLVDQTERLLREGASVRDAVSEAGRRRLRPILMTTLTTLLGLLPLALGIGEGADAQAPLARAVIGGLAASTPLTLLLVPAVYVATHRDKLRSTGESRNAA
ncbi:MAG: efflux RND transporter permease subunit, partial [Myxococcota bacterium]